MSMAEKLQTIAENEQRVYDAGKQAEYDAFWDSYQQNGKLRYCPYHFAGKGWNNYTFKPKYNIVAHGNCAGMFRDMGTTDIRDCLIKAGVVLNIASGTNFQYTFGYGNITALPKLNFSSATTLQNTFSTAVMLEEIEEMIVTENISYPSAFLNCTALKDITITGVIGNNFSIEYSPLTKESFTSIINALSPTTTGKVVTFNKAAKEAAFTADEWATLIATKPNWTIALA